MLFFFTNLSLMEFQVRYLGLFLLFSVIDDFKGFGMESLHKNIQLMLEFLKGSFLVLPFSCCILITFPMLSVILLSMLIILVSILTVMRHLISGNNLNWLQNLNLIYETHLDWVKKWLVDFNAGKTQQVSFDSAGFVSNNNGSIDMKMDGSVFEEK